MGILTKILFLSLPIQLLPDIYAARLHLGVSPPRQGICFLKPIGMMNSTITGTVVPRYIHISRRTVFGGFKVLSLWVFASPYYC